ncbi:membrane protein insertion efficiency factor YidD [Zobellella sp. An-6]|uniref:membrane protein insertion efficiency factor YidD n=1 Tax=Zobellella sp. An-6 TaxID=3400218 RepID=UPI0040439133
MLVRFSVWAIRVYQRTAPASLRETCRFEPSCSNYAILALQKHGFLSGWKKALIRIYHCKPPHGGQDYP